MQKTKIDWCDETVNPVVGCSNACPYCYAKRLNSRFKWIKDFSSPEYFPERLKDFNVKAPKNIFINSMSDISQWGGKTMLEVAAAIKANPQHHYIALTKSNCLYANKTSALEMGGYDISGFKSLFLGATITSQSDIDKLGFIFASSFINIEPMLSPIRLSKLIKQIHLTPRDMPQVRQVIIGAETGNRRNKVIPMREWVNSVVNECDEHNLRVFMKDSLQEIMLNDFRQDKLIWAFD